MIACPNKNTQEWKDLVTKFNGDEDLAAAAWGREQLYLDVQSSNLKNVETGKKTISIRTTGSHSYEVGDILKVRTKRGDTGTRVRVESITTVDDFTKLPDNRKDDFARAIGDYKDYNDFKASDDYAREDSPLSIQFPDVYHFIHGKKSADIIKYNKTTDLAEGETQEDNHFVKVASEVKLFLQRKLSMLKQKKINNKVRREAELNKLISDISAVEGAESIGIFVNEAYDQMLKVEAQFNELMKSRSENTMSDAEFVQKLAAFNEVANGYSILDEIELADLDSYFNRPEKGIQEQGSFNMSYKLMHAIRSRKQIKNRYMEEGIPVLADYLLGYKSKDVDQNIQPQVAAIQKRIEAIYENPRLTDKAKERRVSELEHDLEKLFGFSLDKQKLIEQLRNAAKDESALDYLFAPLISSDDGALALFAKAIKSSLEGARLKDLKFADSIKLAYNAFKDVNSKNVDNVAKFNEDLIEIIEITKRGADGKPVKDENGNIVYIKKKAFVQKYNVTAFEKAKDKFFDELGEKPVTRKALKAYNRRIAIWFTNNTQPKSMAEVREILDAKKEEYEKGNITQLEYNEWLDSVLGKDKDGNTIYKRELTEPSHEYINDKWRKLYIEDGIPASKAGEYHSFLVNSYLESQQELPENYRKGFILPSIPKDNIERALTSGIASTAKRIGREAIKVQAYDSEYGIASLGETGDVKYLPIHYTHNMDVDDVSSDVLSSVMRFTSMTNRYKALNDINGQIDLMQNVIGQRSVNQTNSMGRKVVDAFAQKMGYTEYLKTNGEPYSKKHIDDFIQMVVYGEMLKKEELGGYDLGKMSNIATGYSAITTLAVDFLKGTANNLQGNIQMMIEAASGQYFSGSNLRSGKAYYARALGGMLGDFGKIAPDSLGGKLTDLFDAIQGEFTDNYGKNVSGSIARKLFRTNTLFFNQHAAEHEIQVSCLFAHLDAHTVDLKETGETITLLEAFDKYKGDLDAVIENTDFTQKRFEDLQNRIHALNKKMHGVYNSFDKGTAQRYTLGRLAIMYRKHLIPGYKRRWGKLKMDHELGDITEGYYRTFNKTFIRDLRDMKFNIANNWSNYTDFEKAQIKRTLAEAAFIIGLTSLVFILKNIGDDDEELKKNWAYNFLLYEAVRMRSETASYISPLDAYRVVKSPSAMTTTADRVIRFADQLLFTWDPDKQEYDRKVGVFEKGTNKSYAYFLKLMGFSSYNFHPEEAVKSFEGTLNK